MAISLSLETQRLIEERRVRHGYWSADEVVRAALECLDFQDELQLDWETVQAIEEGEAQLERGEGRRWEEVRQELRTKYLRQ
jgi:Arc/MetJ-type ribon-helix-helix transcriptional regulator